MPNNQLAAQIRSHCTRITHWHSRLGTAGNKQNSHQQPQHLPATNEYANGTERKMGYAVFFLTVFI
ncbi:MAG: hypothetical protein EAY75_07345 [Bacteroidetes bacterium]|nr:MAG: hypothetical protein EAY75_07345 [Bacteroidota bacterium]